MSEDEFLAAVAAGYRGRVGGSDLICLGEMGIGNTTAAAAIAAALFGGGGARWAGRGTGVDEAGLARKRAVIDRALARHRDACCTIRCASRRRSAAASLPPFWARCWRRGGMRIPVLLDGFVCTAAVAPLAKLRADALAHTLAAHVSAEAGHRMLLDELKLKPLLDLDMRLGEASGAALGAQHPARRARLPHRHGDVCPSGRFRQEGRSDTAAENGQLGKAEGCRAPLATIRQPQPQLP